MLKYHLRQDTKSPHIKFRFTRHHCVNTIFRLRMHYYFVYTQWKKAETVFTLIHGCIRKYIFKESLKQLFTLLPKNYKTSAPIVKLVKAEKIKNKILNLFNKSIFVCFGGYKVSEGRRICRCTHYIFVNFHNDAKIIIEYNLFTLYS